MLGFSPASIGEPAHLELSPDKIDSPDLTIHIHPPPTSTLPLDTWATLPLLTAVPAQLRATFTWGSSNATQLRGQPNFSVGNR
jgi:hypothetical protein